MPGAANGRAGSSRAASTIAAGSASSRRAANRSASVDAPSSHWASSTMHKQRLLIRNFAEQGEYAERDVEAVVHRLGRERERGSERRRLPLRQPLDPIEYRPKQLVQTGKGQVRLGLDPDAAQDRHPGRLGFDVFEERRLADACLAADHEDAAATVAGSQEQAVERLCFRATADEHLSILRRS